ncbi:MAG: hypothetical protein N4A49_12110 [Marinifilaceae bacterium]|jgi:protein SCO1/2|nr:hypothetical protein [Marinifilaceae bacterium]
MRLFQKLCTAFICLFLIFGLKAQNDLEVGLIEKLGNHLSDSLMVINIKGDTVRLVDQIDKPTVIMMVYYRCPGICSPLLDGVVEVVNKSDLKLTEDYQVLTISFDYREGADLAKRKSINYRNLITNQTNTDGWKFFASDSINCRAITQALGFRYKKMGNDYLHPGCIMITSKEAKITRYLNGVYFLPFEFKMSLIDAAEGKIGPTVNRLLEFCYSYDPQGKTYVLSITKVTGSIIIFISLLAFLFLVFRRKA